MPIKFACKGCGKSFEVKDSLAGKTGKCSACGEPMKIPSPAYEVAEAPLVVTRKAPVAQPPPVAEIPAPTNQTNVQVVVNQGEKKSVNGLGVAGVVIGVFALLICWVPLLGLAAGPLGLLGGILALVGLLVAVSSKKTGVGWPVAGMCVNFLAVLIMVLVSFVFAGSVGATFQAARKEALKDQAKTGALKKDPSAVLKKAIDAVRESAASSFGTEESKQAKIEADRKGIKEFGKDTWEVKGTFEGPDGDGKRFKSSWTARISYFLGNLQCEKITLGERTYLDQ